MTKTKKERQKVVVPLGIRHKLTAALCMLLVASIMMVSSTYAWFTLSTAPEVTGITTNVGANGNLEIVLLNKASKASTADDLGIQSLVNQSSAVLGAFESNVFWGNIVDLSPANYGLDNIVLLPARAAINGEDSTSYALSEAGSLFGPTYGYDGRVVDINKPASLGAWNGAAFNSDAEAAGVSAIGISGGLSARVSAFRTAKAAATAAASSALAAARNSLSANGQALADLMVALAMHQTDYKSYLGGLNSMLTGVQTANKSLETAIKQAALAYALSGANTADLTDEQVFALTTAMNGDTTALADLGTALGVALPQAITDLITIHDGIKDKLTSAADELSALNEQATVSEAEIKVALKDLVDPDKVTVAGYHASEVKEHMGDVVAAATGGGIPIVMEAGSGVFDSMAQAVGSFTVSTKVSAEYNGIQVNNMDATISTETGENYQNKVADFANGLAEPSNEAAEGSAEPLDDIYGYQLDFGFRTNAAGSFLKLQTEGVQRVYSDGDADSTQGGGSYMEFTSGKLDKEEVLALMSTVRVLFVDASDSNKILAVATPDITVTVNESTAEVTYAADDAYYAADTNTWKIPLVLRPFTLEDAPDGGPKVMKLGEKKTAAEGGNAADNPNNLCQLTQNVAKKISVITYFDGDLIDNTMVANDTQSMTGKLNLQFSSTATLKAMENSGLRGGGTPAIDPSITYTEYHDIGTKEVAFGGTDYTIALKSGYTIYTGSDSNYYYKADAASTHMKIDITDYQAMINSGAFVLTPKS